MSAVRMKSRRQRQVRKPASLNLVSLMDIFTILVFFLMVNSSDVQVLETSTDIKLPDSAAEETPEERLVISVSQEDLMVMGRRVATLTEIVGSEEMAIAGLKAELDHQAGRVRSGGAAASDEEGLAVTIMGDRELPYEILKRIMLTCQQSGYTRIALAVNRIDVEEA